MMMTVHDLRPEVAVVLGTRPELIKLAGVMSELGDACGIIFTGQHYDAELISPIFEDCRVPEPAIRLAVGGKSRAAQIGTATAGIDEVLASWRPRVVIVQGDTNSALAGALAANAREIPLVHVEAGLRSFDRRMPEEHNRVIIDHIADLCCAPTSVNVANLLAEGIPESRIVLTGNTVVDAVEALLPGPDARALTRRRLGVPAAGYVLATFHRPENVDHPERLGTILDELERLSVPVVFPVHPRTHARIAGLPAGVGDRRDVLMSEPIGYADFLGLAADCALLVSDSGGVQEEASVLKRPVVVVRRSTERPEVQGTFAVLVDVGQEIGDLAQAWLGEIGEVHRRLATIPSPYGDGHASTRTVKAMRSLLDG